jgi:uncharacterized protein involved in exopolysaccharide biosynthesis
MAESTADVTLREISRILFRHKKKALALFCLVTIGTAFLVLFRQKQYRSEAQLFVHIGRESVSLDPTASQGATVSLRTTREIEINSIIEMLNSRAIAEQVVDIIGAESILAPGVEAPWIMDVKQPVLDTCQRAKRAMRQMLFGEESSGQTRQELAVSQLMKNMSVRAAEMSSVISVACRAQSPEMAQKIVAAIVEVHGREHARVNRIAGSEGFFREQTTALRERLYETNQKLSDLKNQKGIGSIEAQFRLLESHKATIEAQQLDNARELTKARARTGSLKESLSSLAPTVVAQWVDGLPNLAADGMRQQLYDLEIKERELRSKYGEKHPYVMAIRRQVAEARKIQDSQHESRTQSTHAVNPNWQQLQLQLCEEEVKLAALLENEKTLQQQHDSVQAALADLNVYALQVAELERDSQLLADRYKAHSSSLEQARIDSALTQQRITNVNVAQPATFVTQPVGPSRKLLTGLGMILGLFGGMAWALVAEHYDQSLKSPAEVERLFTTPVLMSIPRTAKPGPFLIAKKKEKAHSP